MKEKLVVISIVVGFIIGIVWLFSFIAVSIANQFMDLTSYEIVETQTIVSIADRFNIQGSYFIWSSTINEVPKYSYYRIDKDGDMFWETIPAADTIIHESDETPHVEFLKARFNNKILQWLFPNGKNYYTYIYVPKGTVLNQYKLDAQ